MKVYQFFTKPLLVLALSVALPNSWLLTTARPAEDHKPEPDSHSRPINTKYFFESGNSKELSHYDNRHFKGIVTPDEKIKSLENLIKSYMTTFHKHNIETWIAHGTLLGWWWNGKIMPWDWDIDTQVSSSTLYWLGKHLNMTTHSYKFREKDGILKSREYLLDVNPYITERERGDGNNVIDARWIDIQNGLYIDITGLSEMEPGILSCKNEHHYPVRDLYPLRDSSFEGVNVKVPYKFDNILIKEYSDKALKRKIYEGHRWIPKKKLWIKEKQ